MAFPWTKVHEMKIPLRKQVFVKKEYYTSFEQLALWWYNGSTLIWQCQIFPSKLWAVRLSKLNEERNIKSIEGNASYYSIDDTFREVEYEPTIFRMWGQRSNHLNLRHKFAQQIHFPLAAAALLCLCLLYFLHRFNTKM